MKYISAHKALAITMAAVAVSLISFSGYAYANGTNPFSLLKRWTTGEEVNVMYDGREFKHGKSRTYSDAAVTAFAELQTIDKLAWQASSAYTIPKDGIEHVSNPYSHEYVHPWVGTVEQIGDNTLIIRQHYSTGDKIKSAQILDKQLTIDLAEISTFIEGEPAQAAKTVGKLVVVHTESYLRYKTGSKQTPQPVMHQFAFVLSHTLANVKEADQANQPGANRDSADQRGIYEASWAGELSSLCLNNAGNHCDPKLQMPNEGQSFFTCITGIRPGTPCGGSVAADVVNPDVVPIGEALPDEAAASTGLIIRHVEGQVWTMGDRNISIKTSSEQIWVLELSMEQREAFNKRTGNPLKVGDRVGATVISSVNDLDNRTFDNRHIYTMKRY